MGGRRGGRWRATEVDVTFSQSAQAAQGLADVSVPKFRLKGQAVFLKEAHNECGESSRLGRHCKYKAIIKEEEKKI